MAACWIGVLYRAQTLDATISAGVEARRNAWVSSNAGCSDEGLSPACESGDSNDGFSSGGWLDGLADAPIVGFLFGSILGYSTTVRASRTVDRPPVLGGGEARLGYSYYVMCNERPMSVDQVLMAAVCEQLPGIALDLLGDRCPLPRYDSVSCE
jgi:hypothetical protein